MSQTFLYFGYGSNLLAKRILINNPSAIRNGIGKLENYEIDFASYSSRWKGAVATIIPKPGRYVWGAIWKINVDHLKTLDEQEGVSKGIYAAMELDILTPNNEIKKCRLYKLNHTYDHIPDLRDLPMDRRPSPAYLKVILVGAKESELPGDYIKFLNRIPHNGYGGHTEIDIFNDQI